MRSWFVLLGVVLTALLASPAGAQPPPPTTPAVAPTATDPELAPVATPAPTVMPPQPFVPAPPPEDNELTTFDYVPLGIAGLATFGATWLGSIVVALAADSPNKGRAIGHSVVPVVGPFISIAERSHADGIEGLLTGLGVLQGVGVGATLLGFTLESKVEVNRPSTAYVVPMIGPVVGARGAF